MKVLAGAVTLAASLMIGGMACPVPTPQPTPKPTPTVEPTPEPTPTPPIVGKCPVAVPTAEGKRYFIAKVAQHKPNADGTFTDVLDSTPRVRDKAYCEALTGQVGVFDCKANPEGTGQDVCDEEFLGAPCPIWQYKGPLGWQICGVDPHPIASCDHYDGYIDWQGSYEGKCQARVEAGGKRVAVAGFKMTPHGNVLVRACNADATVCSDPMQVNQ